MSEPRRFAYRLALALGQQNPDAMLDTMPYAIWLQWRLLGSLEPFGEARADLRTGIVAATMANIWGRKRGQRAYSPRDFMPRFEASAMPRTARRAKTPDELFEIVKGLNAAFGGETVGGTRDS